MKRLMNFLLGVAIISAVVGPLSYGMYGPEYLTEGLVAGLAIYLAMYLAIPLVLGIRRVPFLARRFDPPLDPEHLGIVSDFGLVLSLAVGVMGGLGVGLVRDFISMEMYLWSVVKLDSEPFVETLVAFAVRGLVAGLAMASVFVFPLYLAFHLSTNVAEFWRTRTHIWIGLCLALPFGLMGAVFIGPLEGMILGLGLSLGGIGGNLLAVSIAARLTGSLNEFAGVKMYLKAMSRGVIGFAVGYLGIILVFAGWFASVYRSDQRGSFTNVSRQDPFSDLLYFSMMTISTLGYSDVKPSSPLAKLLVSTEVMAGIGWTVVVFAALLEHLRRCLDEVHKKQPRGTAVGDELGALLDQVAEVRAALERSEQDRGREDEEREQRLVAEIRRHKRKWWRRLLGN